MSKIRRLLVVAAALTMMLSLFASPAKAVTIERVDVMWLLVGQIADIRDTTRAAMTQNASTTCFSDLSGVPNDVRRSLCWAKNAGIISGSTFNPGGTTERSRGAIWMARSGRWLNGRGGVNGTWATGTRGCDVWSDIACGTTGSAPTGELYQNNIERNGCDVQQARFCPNQLLHHNAAWDTWLSRFDSRMD